MSLSPGSILFVFANTTQRFLQDRKYFTLLTRLLKIDFSQKKLIRFPSGSFRFHKVTSKYVDRMRKFKDFERFCSKMTWFGNS